MTYTYYVINFKIIQVKICKSKYNIKRQINTMFGIIYIGYSMLEVLKIERNKEFLSN